jgi:hypothetical protein
MNKYFILLQIVSDIFRELPAGIMEKQNTEQLITLFFILMHSNTKLIVLKLIGALGLRI